MQKQKSYPAELDLNVMVAEIKSEARKTRADFESALKYYRYLFCNTKLALRYNLFTDEIELDGKAITYSKLRLSIADEFDFDLPISEEFAICTLLKECCGYNPILSYLNSLPSPQNSPYVHIAKAFGISPADFEAKLIVLTLLGAVNRAFEPGCKMQTLLILHSIKQGLFKSSFWEALAPANNLFVEPIFTSQDNKYLMSCYRGWLVNTSEIDALLSKRDANVQKDFITRPADTFVPMYARKAQTFARHWILVGSTNEHEFLKDSENRRYWVVPINQPIDIPYILANRDDLWAGILELYANNQQYWFDEGSPEAQLIAERNLAYRHEFEQNDKLIAFIEAQNGRPFSLKDCAKHIFCWLDGYEDGRKLNKLKTELKALGFVPIRRKQEGVTLRLWAKE